MKPYIKTASYLFGIWIVDSINPITDNTMIGALLILILLEIVISNDKKV